MMKETKAMERTKAPRPLNERRVKRHSSNPWGDNFIMKMPTRLQASRRVLCLCVGESVDESMGGAGVWV